MQLASYAPAALGLASATAWGCGDFSGGLAARRANVFGVVVAGYATAFVLLIVCALARHETFPPSHSILWAIPAGLVGGLALAAFYAAMAAGQMGIVAPVAAVLTAALPVIFGAFVEGAPRPWQIAGFALAGASLWMVSRPQKMQGRPHGLGLAIFSGIGFGAYLILIRQAQPGAGVFWPLAISRACSTVSVLAVTAALGKFKVPPAGQATALSVAAGVLDGFGVTLFVLAARMGRLDVAAALSSLYPVVPVILARAYLNEHLATMQRIGMIATLVAAALIAA